MDHPAGSSNMSSTSRRAGPTRPSPLSRLHSSPGASFQDKTRSGHYTYAQRQAGLLPESTSPTSPCFVHSHLERYSQLDDRLRAKLDHNIHHQENNRNGTEPDRLKQINTQGQAGNRAAAVFGYNSEGPSPRLSLHPANGQTDLGFQQDHNRNSVYAPSPSDLDDAEDGGSLTRQLAETATGVREMSKQLGRTKVRSNIQSVLIVTKARDNRLIKLTREVAVYLMRMKRQANGDRGMIV
jgi:NAD+ kinase